jgi:cell division protein FtsA
MVVFENNIPLSLEVFPIGSNDITTDIALGLRSPLEEAEKVKTNAAATAGNHGRKKIDEIINARLSDIFELIDLHLKKINRNGLLPAGIVITGGGSSIDSIEHQAKNLLKLPSRIAEITAESATKTQIKDATWSVAYGLCIFGLNSEEDHSYGLKNFNPAKNKIIEWIKQFLP